MSSFTEIMALMAKNPPDPNGSVPVSNRPETMYGATIPFHVLSWAAVIFRLYVRFKVVREPSWDDYIVTLSAFFNLAALGTLIAAINYGLGEHLLYIGEDRLTVVMKLLYIQGACYYTCTGLIKLSLLCQYLRIFKTGLLRRVCLILIVIISCWGAFWLFQGWFPCFPVSGYWNRLQTPPPKCWGMGFSTVNGALTAFISFAATNMILDTIIFLIPMAVYFRPGISGKEIFALLALFSLGSLVVLMAILRLWTAVRQRSFGNSALDFTWWYPLTLIISSLEIDFAIICASIPIFWPVIVASLPQIFVTKEVHVTHHHRVLDNGVSEFELGRPHSLKSSTSQEGLTRSVAPKTDYTDQLVVDHVTGTLQSAEIAADSKPRKGWLR